MATVIDSLIVTLGLDSTGFNVNRQKVDSGLRETGNQADQTGKKLKKAGKDGSESFQSLSKTAAQFLAIIGGTMAIKAFVQDVLESSAALDRLSKNLGENVNTISAWSQAAEQAGGTASGLQGTMDMLSKSQTELMLTGESSLIPYFTSLGISLADTNGKARPVNDLLMDMATSFGRMDRTTANNMGRMMGLDQGTMNLLLKGRQEIEMTIKRQKEYGAVTKQQAEEASRLKRAITEGRQSFEAFGRELLSAATPALEKLLAVFSDMGAWMRENQEFVTTFLKIVAVGLGLIAAAVTPINLTIAAVVALAGAIALLYQDYQTWKRGGESFIDWGKWEPGFKAAGNAIRWIRDLLGDLIYRAIAAADVLAAVFEQDWERAKFAAGEFISGNGKKYGSQDPEGIPPVPTTAPGSKLATVSTVNSTSKSPAGTPAQENAAISYFQRMGWSKEQAAGIVANMKRESNLRPDAIGDGGKAFGIAQWHPDRQAQFKKVFGKPIQGSTLEEQLAFVNYELTQGNETGAGNKLRGAKTAQEAGGIVSRYYERPMNADSESLMRGGIATNLLNGFPGASVASRTPGAMAFNQPANAGNQSTVTIGEVKVYTSATDADGIAKDMGSSLNSLYASNANYGNF
jgi:hypothetical protein